MDGERPVADEVQQQDGRHGSPASETQGEKVQELGVTRHALCAWWAIEHPCLLLSPTSTRNVSEALLDVLLYTVGLYFLAFASISESGTEFFYPICLKCDTAASTRGVMRGCK